MDVSLLHLLLSFCGQNTGSFKSQAEKLSFP